MKEPELKPCPFCGGKAKAHVGMHHFYDAKVVCLKCGAEGPLIDEDSGVVRENVRIATEQWNTRTTNQGSA